MTQIEFEETLPYSAEDLYDTVMDIEQYPDIFAFVQSVDAKSVSDELVKASLVVKTPIMNFSYECEISHKRPSLVDIKATKGPFKSMNAQWRFTPLPNGNTKVHYQMDYELGFGLLNKAAKFFLESQVEQTRTHLLSYVSKTLTPVSKGDTISPPQP